MAASSNEESAKAKQFQELRDMFECSSSKAANLDEQPSVWLKLIRDKLFDMFRTPMKDDYTHEAFKWVANLCISLGDFSWLAPDHNWTSDDAKVFSLLARLSMNEIHILLPMINRHLATGDESDLEEGKVLARSAGPEEYDRFGNHLVILEAIIKSLVKDMDDFDDSDNNSDNKKPNKQLTRPSLSDVITGAELKSLLERLQEVIKLICDYLELVHTHWQSLIQDQDSDRFAASEGALRIVCIWLSEDPGSFEAECTKFVIHLIVDNLLLTGRSTKHDLLIMALHSACTYNDALSKCLAETPSHKQALENYLSYIQDDNDNQPASAQKRNKKVFKLRCGLLKDLMSVLSQYTK